MENLDKQYQSMLILWAALLMNIGVFFVFAFVSAPSAAEPAPFSSLFSFGAAAVGTFFVVMSFIVKGKILQRSVDQQDVALVRTALIVACGMCEIAALLGIAEAFVLGNRDYFLLLFIAAAGIALHFPRRIHLEAASYKTGAKQTL